MSVRDDRLPPFAWLALEDLERIRRRLPLNRQAAARNAFLALAEAASRRRDGTHSGADGDTLRDLALIAGVSERRLRDHLRDLESVGLIRIEAALDEHRRPLPTTYVLTGPDESSGYPDATASDRPGLRARVEGQEKEPSLLSPLSRARGDEDEDEHDLEDLVEHVRGVLQRGVDGLTTEERCITPGPGAIRAALAAHPVDAQTARLVAVEVRSIAQAQNRAPNIVGLYAQRLRAASRDVVTAA